MPSKEALIALYGSEEALKEHMREIARKPRRSSRGGFSDKEFARKMGKVSRRKKSS